jgi:hypothetical protein
MMSVEQFHFLPVSKLIEQATQTLASSKGTGATGPRPVQEQP